MEYHIAYFVFKTWDQAPMAFERKSEHFIKGMINYTELRKKEVLFKVMHLLLLNFKQIKQSAIFYVVKHISLFKYSQQPIKPNPWLGLRRSH